VIPNAEEFLKIDCFGQVSSELKDLKLPPIRWDHLSE
jgi:hypothetical protein